jgi:hypothetical protein
MHRVRRALERGEEMMEGGSRKRFVAGDYVRGEGDAVLPMREVRVAVGRPLFNVRC